MTLEKIKKVLDSRSKELKEFGVKSLSVFGSVARGESKSSSDIDLLVEFDAPVGMFHFLEFKYFLEDLLEMKVDLSTEKALHPMLKDNILREAVRVA